MGSAKLTILNPLMHSLPNSVFIHHLAERGKIL